MRLASSIHIISKSSYVGFEFSCGRGLISFMCWNIMIIQSTVIGDFY